MAQSKSLISLGGSIPPQEVFLSEGSFVAHRGLDEYYEYSFLIREGLSPVIPLVNNFPIIIENLFWNVSNSGFTLQALVRGYQLWLYDTTGSGDIVTPKSFVLPEQVSVRIINKSSDSDLIIIFQAKRSSLVIQPNFNI